MSKFSFKEFEIEHIIKPKLKNSYLSIDENLHIIVKTPKVHDTFVEKLLFEKEHWIRKQHKKILSNRAQKIKLTEEVLFFGEVVNIHFEKVLFLQKKLEKLKSANTQTIIKTYDSFYKHTAQEYLSQRVEYFSSLMNLSFKSIKYRKMKRRWGSCNSLKVLTFNTQLIKVKKELIDYVIVHEIAHIKYMNHSKEFHSLVERYLPNSKQLRHTLKNLQLTE